MVRSFLCLAFTLAYISYRRIVRRIEWFFLCRLILKRPKLARLLRKSIERAFKDHLKINRLTAVLYFHRGYGNGESTDTVKTIYWEAPLAITAWTSEGPAFGMGIEFRSDALCIRQLQGVGGTHLPEELKQWPKIFVSGCLRFARRAGIKHVRLYRADQSLFYYWPMLRQDGTGDAAADALKDHQRRMRRRYDGTARQLGLAMKNRWGEWTHPAVL